MKSTKTKVKVNETELSNTINGLVEHLKNNPNDAKATFTAKSELNDGFQSKVYIREFEFASDEPEQLGGTNIGPNPVEYVLGALAACQEIVVKTHAALLGIKVKSVKVKVEGDLDLQGFLNIAGERAGFKNIKFHTFIKTDEEDSGKLNRLKELTIDHCPVLDIIQNPVPIEGRISYTN